MGWAVLGIVVAGVYFLYGLTNKPHIHINEEYEDFDE
jgi:hypothetical protein